MDGTLGDSKDGFERTGWFKSGRPQGKGFRQSLGCLRGLKPNLNSVETVPGARRRQRVFMSPLGTSSATVLVD